LPPTSEEIWNGCCCTGRGWLEKLLDFRFLIFAIKPYPTAFPYGNGMVLHFYQQQESSTNKTVHRVINKRQSLCIVASHWWEFRLTFRHRASCI
jgi:hypothetical protein